MKISRAFLIVIIIFVIILVAVFAYAALVTTSNSSKWELGADYPLEVQDTIGVSGQQCVNSASYIVCIGGMDISGGPQNGVYLSSSVSSSGGNITGWAPESYPYPQPIFGQSCVTYSGFVYCVGGTYDDGGDDLATSYYAPLSSTGIVGKWNSTTAFPVPVDSQYCIASSGYIYCLGGWTESNGLNASRALSSFDYFAPISSSGIGDWNQTAPYPTGDYLPSCYSENNYIYCLGGVDGGSSALSTAYYAPLSSSGLGPWTATTSYPFDGIGQSCAFSSGYIYCVGGETSSGFSNLVYYALVSPGGIGQWVQGATYPEGIWTNCVIVSGNMYCVGGLDSSSNGETGATHFIDLTSLTTSTS